MFLLQYLALIIFKNRLWLYLIIPILYNIYEFSTHTYLFDSDSESLSSVDWRERPVEVRNRSVYELDGRSIHELDGRSIRHLENRFAQTSLHNEDQTKIYNPYNPNYVQTSQGWRTELPVSHYTSRSENNWSINYTSDNISRIPHPSHYREDLHSTFSYPLGEIDSQASDVGTYPLGEIEPTRSHLDNNGIYSGNLNSNVIEHTKNYRHPDTTYFSRFINRIKRGFDYIDQKVEKDLVKYHEKCRFQAELERKRLYIKGYGRVTNSELRYLNNSGYSVENSRVVKMLYRKKN